MWLSAEKVDENVPTTGPGLESKGMRAIFQKIGKTGQKIFENLGKNV